jgi:hypothetical protein
MEAIRPGSVVFNKMAGGAFAYGVHAPFRKLVQCWEINIPQILENKRCEDKIPPILVQMDQAILTGINLNLLSWCEFKVAALERLVNCKKHKKNAHALGTCFGLWHAGYD